MKIGPHHSGSGWPLPHAARPVDPAECGGYCPPTAKRECPPTFCPPTAKSRTDVDRYDVPRFRRPTDEVNPALLERLSLFGAADPSSAAAPAPCAGAGGSGRPAYGVRPIGEIPPGKPTRDVPPPPIRPEAYPTPTNLGSLIDVLV